MNPYIFRPTKLKAVVYIFDKPHKNRPAPPRFGKLKYLID
jgi:hypothetical protein